MTLEEIRTLFKVLTSYDNRNVGEADFLVWGRQLAEFEFADVIEAVHRYYGEPRGNDRAMPADVRALAVKVRNARTKRPEVVAPGCYEPDPLERRRLVADDGGPGPLALPSRFENDPVRTVRIKTGLAGCHEVLDVIAAKLAAQRSPEGELDHSEQTRQRALQRAALERRTKAVTE